MHSGSQLSIFSSPSSIVSSQCTSRHSSRSDPLKPSTKEPLVGLRGPLKSDQHVMAVCPEIHQSSGEFAAVAYEQTYGSAAEHGSTIACVYHILRSKVVSEDDANCFARKHIHVGQNPYPWSPSPIDPPRNHLPAIVRPLWYILFSASDHYFATARQFATQV